MQLVVRKFPFYATEEKKFDPIVAIQNFDAGGGCVYLTDAAKKFTGFAIPKTNFKNLWQENAPVAVPCICVEDNNLSGGV